MDTQLSEVQRVQRTRDLAAHPPADAGFGRTGRTQRIKPTLASARFARFRCARLIRRAVGRPEVECFAWDREKTWQCASSVADARLREGRNGLV
jgi:hypothetical protein